MNTKPFLPALLCLGWIAMTAPAFAQDSTPPAEDAPWLFRFGVANIQNSSKATLNVGGAPIPGAALHFDQIYTPMVEIGYRFADDFTAVATLGFPPTISASGAGSIAAYGKLEGTTWGPTAFTVQYQPFHDGLLRPYVGAGVSYMIIFDTHPAVVQNPGLSNDLAPALEAGTEIVLSDQYHLFIEGKKAFLSSNVTGTIGGFPLTGTADLSPWVFSVGMGFRF
jgi:outer membrane protein